MTKFEIKPKITQQEIDFMLFKKLVNSGAEVSSTQSDISKIVWELLFDSLWLEDIKSIPWDVQELYKLFRTKTVYIFSHTFICSFLGEKISDENLRTKIKVLRNFLPKWIDIITVPKYWYYMYVEGEDISKFTSILKVSPDFLVLPKLHSIQINGKILVLRKQYFDYLYTLLLNIWSTVKYEDFIGFVEWIETRDTKTLSDIKNRVRISLNAFESWLWDNIISVGKKGYKWK